MLETHEEILYGKDQETGILEWLEEMVEGYYEGEKDVLVFSNRLEEGDELRKGKFPSIQIYPGEDSFERKNERTMIHEITISLAISTKGPKKEAFQESSYMAEELYTRLKNVAPRIGPVRDPPVEGEINYSWDGFQRRSQRNSSLSHSNIEFNYRFRC
ncbi:MAG: hypothetical protein ACLFU5_09475 [Thermoplasmata archaeon]